MRALSAFLLDPFKSALRHRALVRELARREIHSTFAGSMLGVSWIVLRPLLSLAVYASVFGGLLSLHAPGGGMLFVSQLFTGMIVYEAFSQTVARAPHLIISHPSYVTKVAFPLDLLAWPSISLTALHVGVSTLLLLLLHTVFVGIPAWTFVLLPLVLIPVLLLGLGLSWILASLGVYIRDTADITAVGLQLLFFVSPIIWTLDLVENESTRATILLNPLAVAMEACRALVAGTPLPGVGWLAALGGGTLLVCAAGHLFFHRTQDGFADVL